MIFFAAAHFTRLVSTLQMTIHHKYPSHICAEQVLVRVAILLCKQAFRGRLSGNLPMITLLMKVKRLQRCLVPCNSIVHQQWVSNSAPKF